MELIQEWSEQSIPRQPLYVIIFKAMQVYTTTTIAAIANWLCTFFESSRVLELSKKEDDANDFLEKSKFINDNHPDFLRLKLNPDQAGHVGFPATHSRIRALTSTEHSGRSTDATLVVTDEWEFFLHDYAERNFAAVKPTLDKGGIFIGATTIDKTKMDSFPKKIWREAKNGDNDFHCLGWWYYVLPERNEETYARDTQGLADWQKEGEYPKTEEEALSVPRSTCYFNVDVIMEMLKECKKPIEERNGGMVRIYATSVSERKYLFAIDSSEGEYDPAVGIISDWKREEDVVAFRGKISIDQQARIFYELYKEYNKPFIAVERNAAGVLLIDKLTEMGVDTWYYIDKKKDKAGWWTSGTSGGGGTRPVMLSELSEDISGRHMGIPMKDALLEFLSFSWIDGKPKAIRGAHDDYVMAHAILGQIRKSKPAGGMTVSSFKYRDW